MTPPHSNRLIHESSPYLLQHAHNPVDWHPWGEEALQLSKDQNKPILLSIGYAACHWCHVMEKESFENEAVAELMNENFINIKLDREERPDLDHIYMDAVQAMTGSGGWPLNVFLTPEAQPFYGGTYFPPVKAFNRPGWSEVLTGISNAWKNQQESIRSQAATLLEHLGQSNGFGQTKTASADQTIAEPFGRQEADTMFENIMKTADLEWGGFGNAPKFPQSFTIGFLMQYYYYTGSKPALEQALRSIDKMIEGGIYDQVGGGFSRYSTDNEWLAPHFEKMLYDNALLLNILADAYRLTKRNRYAQVIRQVIGFIKREMSSRQGGFYAALDADSEGEEGKFYVWTKNEIEDLLEEDAEVFSKYYNVTEAGNWEGKNILRVLDPLPGFAEKMKLPADKLEARLNHSLEILLKQREKRVRPQTDDKILLGWNALMVTALCKVAGALGDEGYKNLAISTMEFILANFKVKKDGFEMYHTFKDGRAKYPAFLDDYAYLIQAAIQLYEVSSDPQYCKMAEGVCNYVSAHFSETETGYFFFTREGQEDVILRKKEVHDGAVPSGNSIMAENLFYLSIVTNRADWKARAIKICTSLQNAVVKYPTSFGIWASNLLAQSNGVDEIVITGKSVLKARERILAEYLPGKILICGEDPGDQNPMLAGKNFGEDPMFYLCRNYECKAPVFSIDKLLLTLTKRFKN